MRLALALALLAVACGSSPPPTTASPSTDDTPPPQKSKTGKASKTSESTETFQVAPTGPETSETRCTKTRDARVKQAKGAIQQYRARTKELASLTTWTHDHKCSLRDANGPVTVTKDAQPDAVPDEIVCDAKPWPDGLTVEVMREILLRASTPDEEIMFSTYAECDPIEKPSLRFRFADTAQQDAILASP